VPVAPFSPTLAEASSSSPNPSTFPRPKTLAEFVDYVKGAAPGKIRLRPSGQRQLPAFSTWEVFAKRNGARTWSKHPGEGGPGPGYINEPGEGRRFTAATINAGDRRPDGAFRPDWPRAARHQQPVPGCGLSRRSDHRRESAIPRYIMTLLLGGPLRARRHPRKDNPGGRLQKAIVQGSRRRPGAPPAYWQQNDPAQSDPHAWREAQRWNAGTRSRAGERSPATIKIDFDGVIRHTPP